MTRQRVTAQHVLQCMARDFFSLCRAKGYIRHLTSHSDKEWFKQYDVVHHATKLHLAVNTLSLEKQMVLADLIHDVCYIFCAVSLTKEDFRTTLIYSTSVITTWRAVEGTTYKVRAEPESIDIETCDEGETAELSSESTVSKI